MSLAMAITMARLSLIQSFMRQNKEGFAVTGGHSLVSQLTFYSLTFFSLVLLIALPSPAVPLVRQCKSVYSASVSYRDVYQKVYERIALLARPHPATLSFYNLHLENDFSHLAEKITNYKELQQYFEFAENLAKLQFEVHSQFGDKRIENLGTEIVRVLNLIDVVGILQRLQLTAAQHHEFLTDMLSF